jgi:CDP-4-dehydro-6-deoxyglucose reductase, E3
MAMTRELRARLSRRQVVADGVEEISIHLVDDERFHWRPGQFVTLSIPVGRSGTASKRLSIASRGDRDASLRFILRIADSAAPPDPLVLLDVGSELGVSQAQGSFVLETQHVGDVVFAVTGTALAPVLSMLDELSFRKEAGRRLVFWGLRRESDIFMPDEVARLCDSAAATLQMYLSQPSAEWPGLRGRITRGVVDNLHALRAPTFYLAGSRAMVHELRDGLLELGVDRKRQIRTEAFID